MPALAPSLGTAGDWGLGAAPWFYNQWVVKTTSAVKGLVLGMWDCSGTLGMASCSQELKPWGFLSTKVLSCTSWDIQGPAPRLPQPASYSVSWGLHPPSSCAHPALSPIPKRRGANQHGQNPGTLSQSPMCWTLGGPAEPHSTIPGEPMDALPGERRDVRRGELWDADHGSARRDVYPQVQATQSTGGTECWGQGTRGHGGTGPTSAHIRVQVRVPVRWRRVTSPRAAPGESRRCLSLLPGPGS